MSENIEITTIEWMELLTRVLGDYTGSPIPEQFFDVAYLLAETEDNASSVWCRGADLWRERSIPLGVQQFGEGWGYVGSQRSRKALQDLGVSASHIVSVPMLLEFEQLKEVNTLTELITMVRYAKEHEWKRILLIAPHFHQLRSFMTAVTALDREYPELKVYNNHL